jgi:hypothetical protein
MRRACLLFALLAGCSTAPPQHFTRLWVEGRTGLPTVGTSTEDGVLVLAEPEWKVGDQFEIQFPYGNSLVADHGRIDRLNDTIAIVTPLTSRLREGRFAAELPVEGEPLYVALRDENDEPLMAQAASWRDGAMGDWLLVPGQDAVQLARDYAGTAVYVRRSGRWEIVGVLAGLTAHDESGNDGSTALGYVSLAELARILPDQLDYFAHDVRPLRPDFEFGVPLQPGEMEPPATAEPASTALKEVPEPLKLLPVPNLLPSAGAKGAAPKKGASKKAPPKGKAKPKSKPQPKPQPPPGKPPYPP